MDITLEQSLGSAVRYILDNDVEGVKAYFDEIPEHFYVPSVYFPVPLIQSRKATLRSYCNTVTFETWVMARTDWDAQIRASKLMDRVMLDSLTIPIITEDGQVTGKAFHTLEPTTRRIEEGIVAITIPIKDYFMGHVDYDKIQQFYIAVKKNYYERG